MTMDRLSIAIGLFLILSGIIVAKRPRLLSGFNAMGDDVLQTEKAKKAIRIISLSLIIGGIILLIGYAASVLTDGKGSLQYVVIAAIAVPAICSIYQAGSMKGGQSRALYIVFVSAIVSLLIGCVWYASEETAISYGNQRINIKAFFYKETINPDEIAQINISDSLPEIKRSSYKARRCRK